MVYFARHGESEANIRNVFSNEGFKYPLTLKGINQAITLADQLMNKNIRKIITSPVLRAIQTASIICDHIGIESYEVYERLREYDVGDLEDTSDSHSWSQYFENEKAWKDADKRHYRLPIGESFMDIQHRFRSCITKIISDDAYTKRNIVIITHGGLLKVGLPAICLNVDYEFTFDHPINNCELICCDIVDNRLQCLKWGCETLG